MSIGFLLKCLKKSFPNLCKYLYFLNEAQLAPDCGGVNTSAVWWQLSFIVITHVFILEGATSLYNPFGTWLIKIDNFWTYNMVQAYSTLVVLVYLLFINACNLTHKLSSNQTAEVLTPWQSGDYWAPVPWTSVLYNNRRGWLNYHWLRYLGAELPRSQITIG